MDVKVLASGSKANCVWIGNSETSILIDVGLAKTVLEKTIVTNGIDPTKIDAVFISHAHGDHYKGIAFADKYKIPVYASEGALKDLKRLDSGKIIKANKTVGFDALRKSLLLITAFSVHHDAAEPLGYTVTDADGFKVSVLMDTGKVTDEMIKAMAYSNVYVFECNHDVDMVVDGPYDETTKSRILCDIGHLSNDQSAEALAQLVKGRGEQVYLTHMSTNNNMPALALGTVKRALKAKGFIAGQHYHMEVV